MIEFEAPISAWLDYRLIDCGDGEKLEQFGNRIIRRPEPKARNKRKSWDEEEWDKLPHAHFKAGSGLGKPGVEDSGKWIINNMPEENWVIEYQGEEEGLNFKLKLALTSYKHIGVFPEQAPNWEFIYAQTKRLVDKANKEGKPSPKILNLFAYTGAASLAARAAGADVTHLDSLKQVVTWARENMELSGMSDIRWVVEDAMKFVQREAKRGNTYQGIILDPPAYGHGPKGEKWLIDDYIFDMLTNVNRILDKEDGFMVLNLYFNGCNPLWVEHIVKEAFGHLEGQPKAKFYKHFDSAYLGLDDSHGKVLPMSVFLRLIR